MADNQNSGLGIIAIVGAVIIGLYMYIRRKGSNNNDPNVSSLIEQINNATDNAISKIKNQQDQFNKNISDKIDKQIDDQTFEIKDQIENQVLNEVQHETSQIRDQIDDQIEKQIEDESNQISDQIDDQIEDETKPFESKFENQLENVKSIEDNTEEDKERIEDIRKEINAKFKNFDPLEEFKEDIKNTEDPFWEGSFGYDDRLDGSDDDGNNNDGNNNDDQIGIPDPVDPDPRPNPDPRPDGKDILRLEGTNPDQPNSDYHIDVYTDDPSEVAKGEKAGKWDSDPWVSHDSKAVIDGQIKGLGVDTYKMPKDSDLEFVNLTGDVKVYRNGNLINSSSLNNVSDGEPDLPNPIYDPDEDNNNGNGDNNSSDNSDDPNNNNDDQNTSDPFDPIVPQPDPDPQPDPEPIENPGDEIEDDTQDDDPFWDQDPYENL